MDLEQVVKELDELNRISADELNHIQEEKLKALVQHHYANCEPYRKLMDEKGVAPDDIKTLDDITKLPIIEKEHIIKDSPWGFVSLPRSEIVRFLETSGSTGHPKRIPIGRKEKQRIFELTARCFYIAGMRETGISYAVFPHGPWPSGFFAQNGGEMICPTIPAEMGLPMEWQKKTLRAYKPTYIISSPSFGSKLYDECKDEINFKEIGVKRVLLGGEGMGKGFRKQLEDGFGATVLGVYGCAETGTTAIECDAKEGLHYMADENIIEVVDPVTKKPVKPGETGEMLITVLFKNSMPIVRYRMKDTLYLHDKPCACGSVLPLMSYIMGRSDEMMTLAAANIYPEEIWDVVAQFPELSKDKFQFVVEKDGFKDKATLKVELNKGACARNGIENEILLMLNNRIIELYHAVDKAKTIDAPKIIICKSDSLYRQEGKFKRFLDLREKPE